ncbi:NUDIX hydrolase [Candidatus Beckwithbacteria bacterium]|nr:NUDIX hydrolase [Candidatus Beckwithbacteria bacterium]
MSLDDKAVVSSKKVFDCKWLKVFKEKIRYPDGKVKDYYTLERDNDYVVILAIKDGKIILEKQWRAPLRQWIWEIPMGARNSSETPAQAAKRELQEETGYKAKQITHLGSYWLAPGYSNQLGNVFLVDDFEKEMKTQSKEEAEYELIETKLLSLATFENMIASGKIMDLSTIGAYMLYKSKIKKMSS